MKYNNITKSVINRDWKDFLKEKANKIINYPDRYTRRNLNKMPKDKVIKWAFVNEHAPQYGVSKTTLMAWIDEDFAKKRGISTLINI